MSLADRLWGQKLQYKSLSDVFEEIKILIFDVTKLCPSARILLFGSFASQASTVQSDLDIAVILPNDIDKKIFKKEFYKNRTRIHMPVDFIFRNQTEFENLKIENPVDSEIHQKGIELYPDWKLNDKI